MVEMIGEKVAKITPLPLIYTYQAWRPLQMIYNLMAEIFNSK